MFKVKVNLNESGLRRKAESSTSKAQYILDSQVLKDSNLYVPMDTSTLRDSSIMHSRLGSGSLKWDTPYARRLYYGTTYKFSKDKNKSASSLWFEKAKAKSKKDWIDIASKLCGRGFNG